MSTVSWNRKVPTADRAFRPYRGLMPYTEADEAFFFGRDQDARLIVDNLHAYPMSVLYGPSGVGKSSVLRAGVLRLIREETEHKRQRFGIVETAAAYYANWRDDPDRALPTVIRTALRDSSGRDLGLEVDRLDCPGIVNACDEMGIDLVLVLDQFEDYFLYHDDAGDAFGQQLSDLLAPGSRVSVLLSIREDALAKLDRFEAALPGIFVATLRLEQLDRRAATEAILKPLERLNAFHPQDPRWTAEHGLVEELLNEVSAGKVGVAERPVDVKTAPREPTNSGSFIEAPFLQLVLTRLWDEETTCGSHTLRKSTLIELGGAQQIVREHLDRVAAAFYPTEREVLASIFGYLVTPGGTRIAHTASDLAALSETPEDMVRDVLYRLCQGDQRILREIHPPDDDPSAESRFEIFHDILALAILDWRRRWLAARDQHRAQAALQAEKEAAETAAQDTRRRLRHAQILVGSLVLLLIACAILAGIAFLKNREAVLKNREADRARTQAIHVAISGQLATLSETVGDADPTVSKLLSIAAWRIDPSPNARYAMLAAAAAHRVIGDPLTGHTRSRR